MREILFKAKRIDNGEWVEGYYLRDQYHRSGKDIIFYRKDSDRFTVYTDIIDIETLCQFTGLTDKNGKRIWENDIIQYGAVAAVVKFGEYGNGNLGFYVDFPEETNYRKDFSYWAKKVVVIGNAVDDRSLLQEVLE
jgi:uncharacterized phage protein (TIGR01671 family)